MSWKPPLPPNPPKGIKITKEDNSGFSSAPQNSSRKMINQQIQRFEQQKSAITQEIRNIEIKSASNLNVAEKTPSTKNQHPSYLKNPKHLLVPSPKARRKPSYSEVVKQNAKDDSSQYSQSNNHISKEKVQLVDVSHERDDNRKVGKLKRDSDSFVDGLSVSNGSISYSSANFDNDFNAQLNSEKVLLCMPPSKTLASKRRSLQQFSGKESSRLKICLEIVKTEETYVEVLWAVKNQFIRRLTAYQHLKLTQKPIIDSDEIADIFLNITDIYDLHSLFLNALHEALDRGPNQLLLEVGNIFKQYAQFFKIYTVYCSSYHSSSSVLQKLLDINSDFRDFIAISEFCVETTLQSLLITPVQRIPRYLLLLESLVKATGDNEDIPNLTAAKNAIEDVANHINSSIKLAEARAKVIQIQNRVFRNRVMLVTPHRYFIKEGEMKKAFNKHGFWNGKLKRYKFFLFNDVLIYSSLPSATHQTSELKHMLPILGMRISVLDDDPNMSHSFQIHNKEKPLIVKCDNEVEMNEWISAIKSCIEKIEKDAKSLRQSANTEVIDPSAKSMFSLKSTMESDDTCSTRDSHNVSIEFEVLEDTTRQNEEAIQQVNRARLQESMAAAKDLMKTLKFPKPLEIGDTKNTGKVNLKPELIPIQKAPESARRWIRN